MVQVALLLTTGLNTNYMNEQLKMLPEDCELTKGYEKLRLTAYNDNPHDPSKGKWTYGYGATHKMDGTPVQDGDTITEEEALDLLVLCMAEAQTKVKQRVHVELTKQQYIPLVDFAFNAGSGYHNKLLEYHDYDLWHNINEGLDGDELFNYWTTCAITQGGIKLGGLIRRRKSQVTYFQTGELNFFED